MANPLADLVLQLCKRNQYCSSKFQELQHKEEWTTSNKQEVLALLAELFLHPTCTEDVTYCSSTILLDLVERVKSMVVSSESSQTTSLHQTFCIALSKAVSTCPSLKKFFILYLKNSSPFLYSEQDVTEPASKKMRLEYSQLSLSDSHPLELVQTAYRCVVIFGRESESVISPEHLLPFLSNANKDVQWFTVQTLATLLQMSARQRDTLMKRYFQREEMVQLMLRYRKLLLWPETNVNDNRVNDKQLKTATYLAENKLLDSHVVSVSGILLPKILRKPRGMESELVSVPTTDKNLQHLGHEVNLGCPVLLQGPVGCGKTCLVECLAQMTGRRKSSHLLKLQLGDQTDSRALLGIYQCTDVPGEFVWQPGILTRAVSEGYWVLLEDIDHAPMDVISLLLPLLENKALMIPSRGQKITASPGFQLFATYRTLPGTGSYISSYSSAMSALLEKNWTKLNLDPLSKDELYEIISQKYPALHSIIDRLLEIYFLLSRGEHVGMMEVDDDNKFNSKFFSHDKRLISTRDLLNWCKRIACYDLTSSAISQLVFQETLDCFCFSISCPKRRLQLAEAIGAKLNITKSKAEYYCMKYKPNVQISTYEFLVGRVILPKIKHSTKPIESSHHRLFSFTRQSSALLEKVAACVQNNDPVLLVGETGTGKTSTIQYLANQLGHNLKVINMNQQSDSTDLLGGFKPVDLKLVVKPFKDSFEELFCKTFSRKQNVVFLTHIENCYCKKSWRDMFTLMEHTIKSAIKNQTENSEMWMLWKTQDKKLKQLRLQVQKTESTLAFTFIEGTLVKALKKGDWVLLDEINLATTETLECLSSLLESKSGSVVLSERGDLEPVIRHSNFRLFACMNPATDVGKKALTPSVRNRFMEFYVDELNDVQDLKVLVNDYLSGLSLSPSQIDGLVNFYMQVRVLATKQLTDGTGHKPHYSLRTFCRALMCASFNPGGVINRTLYESLCMSFLTQLDRSSYPLVEQLVCRLLLQKADINSLLKRPIPEPTISKHLQFEGYWIPVGSCEPQVPEKYILTPSVRANLKDLARVVSIGRHPVLLQGETSVGKTSLVQWLATSTGHRCVRINNHEHTDLQEYIGSYAADETGKLAFKEGVLVEAMRQGYWIILDELNLAPTDVLEALNRLLDDNRELFIPETQEMVKAHPKFMLFATQNPPGHYGGRKALSRAFRNRFVELHFDEIPSDELETILSQRCDIPLSYAKKLVKVMLELQTRRSSSAVFAGKQGLMTLRDLFRWANRYHCSVADESNYDWNQHMADHGYMLIGGKMRKPEEEDIVRDILQKFFRRKVCPDSLFNLSSETSITTMAMLKRLTSDTLDNFMHIFWTCNMQRLAVLVNQALQYKEPVLLVGDTGCGKTTVCQMYAAMEGKELYSINCHSNTEGSDFLGGLRPVRNSNNMETEENDDNQHVNKLFEWVDGPLVQAMQTSSPFLVDEISLAEDSVLERLNSVLEPERTLLLSEKGSGDAVENKVPLITAKEDFRVLATMNPGGDFGKKELSPALRNRFTEIWCPQVASPGDMVSIIQHNLQPSIRFSDRSSEGDTEDDEMDIANAIMTFVEWFTCTDFGKKCVVSIRDLLCWVDFLNTCSLSYEDDDDELMEISKVDTSVAYVHGACLVFLDSLGTGTTARVNREVEIQNFKEECLQFLLWQVNNSSTQKLTMETLELFDKRPTGYSSEIAICSDTHFTIPPFSIPRADSQRFQSEKYAFNAPTTCMNAQRILRALQLPRPILLEGSPGVGKTSLVAAIAEAAGQELVRINLSEQTDVSDLFGADLPVEGEGSGLFSWRDGPLLQALKSGQWIILDELNLASQSVLEGLNACLDHRGEVFIPELGKTFYIQQASTRIFACQNPYHQGGGRKGLPRSFLNRFTKVFIDALNRGDLQLIATTMYPSIPEKLLSNMVHFNMKMQTEVVSLHSWGQKGGPWEFNLRDLFRWCELLIDNQSPDSFDPGEYLNLIYADRMQTKLDRDKVIELYQQTFSCLAPIYRPSGHFSLSLDWVQCGHSFLQRHQEYSINIESSKNLKLLPQMLPVLESLMKCVQMNWMTILIGSQNSGKTSTVQMLAELTGNRLQVLPMNSAMDTTELLGGFEQVDIGCHIEEIATRVKQAIDHSSRKQLALGHFTDVENNIAYLYHSWHKYCCFVPNKGSSMSSANELSLMKKQIKELDIIIGQLLNLNREDSNELLEMDSQLTTLSQSLERIENTSNSNTFEWINSTLVRALQSGDWLLVENVNFCNPSVLDRLNALLEPSGVLTVSERGVIDGEVPEIAPHSNFRLFFTMDPKYGNISRAMRNRGVEIYILEDPAGVENLNSEFSLCNSDGSIRTSRAQFPTASLPLIQQYCSYPLLTHAQHLVSVYIEVLRQVLSSAYCCPNVSSSRWPLANFIQLVTNHVHGQNWKLCSELISPLLTEVQLEVNCSDLSTYGGWKFVCGQHDLPELTQVTLIALFGHPLKDILLNCLSSMKTCNNGAEILMRGPYDFQWNKQALYKMMSVCNAESTSTISLLEQLTGVINRIKLSQVLTVEWQLSQEKYKKWEALCEGTQNIASENSAHLKVFVYIDNILVGLRQELRAAFSEQGDCSDKQFYQIYCGLPWLNRLLDVALLHWERELSPPSAANLSLVWNWTFSKLLMPLISHNSPVKLSDKIDKVINHLHDLLSDRKSSSKLLKKILASWGNPTPFFSKWEYLQWQKLQCLAEKIDIFAEDKIKQITLLQTDLLKLNRANITEQFVELITQLNSRMKSTENQQMFESLLDNLELKINSVHSPDSSEQDSECQGSTSVQTLDNDQRLWPLYEHTVLAVERRILNFLLEQHEPELVTWLPPFIEFMKQHLVVSPLNLAEYRKLLSSLGQGNSKSFYSTILSSYFQHWWKNSINGLSLDDFKLSERILGPGIAISSCLVEVIHSLISSHQLKSYGNSNYRFSTDNCVLLPQVAIGHHKNEAQLFAKIRSHLWVHTASLSSLQFNGRNIERKNILESLQHTLMAIGFTLPQFCESDVPDLHLMNNKSTHINTFLSHMKDCCYFDEIVVKLTERAINCVQDMFLDANESNTSAMSIGTALVLVGLLQSYLLGPCGHLDPVERDKLKLSHLQEDLEMINLELKMENLFNELMNGQSFLDLCHNQLHPQIIWLMEYREKLTNKVHGLLSRTAYRPDISSFPMIKQEYANYHMAAGSHELILTFLHKAKTMSEEHFESNEVSRLLQELESWQKTVHNFVQKMQINYPVYRDILTPFYSSLYQMSHGFALIMQSLQTTCCRQKLAKLCNLSNETEFSWLENLCVCMAKFPSCSRNYPNFLELATALTSDLTLQLSHAVVSSQTKTDDSKSISRTNQEIHSQLLLSGLCHLKNHVLTAQELSSPVLDRFASILRLFVSSWHKQQEEQKRLEQERDSLYRFKTIHHDSSPNDERLNEIDFKKRFPNYQNDFIDFIPSNLLDESSNNVGNKSGGDNSAADTDEDEPLSLLITKEEMKEICTIHHQIFTNYTKNSHWIAPGSPEQYDPGVGVDLLKPFLLNYKTAMSLSSYLKACLHEGYDMQVVGGHLLVVAALEEVINHNETTKLGVVKEPAPERYYDVYQDANISEIVQAEPVLRRLLQRLSQLLEEWPDHPTLRQLETISKRILTFPLTSPIMKILSGLELLLYKAQDWESVAAKHVSLETELHDISNLIVDWRKFELSYWKNSLDITSHEVEIEACQWWFHLYQLVISFVTPETDDVDKSKPVSDIEKEIIASLKLFLENSSLGEFKARLQIVYAFHCQLINMDTSPQQQLMCRLLWNIHEFYKQFLPFVEADIEQKRVPIEKELKGFVKIARWNDINYWALKQDTDKTHRTVHKHIRSFKKILHESVKTVLASNKSLINTDTNNEDLSAEVWMRPIALTEDKCANKEFEICLPLAPENSLMSRLTHLMPRACKHYHDLEKKTPYLKLLLAFDEFTCEVIEGIEERSRLHVSPSLEIEKQKKQAKHINLKQRQGLSELYRNLTKIGLSYKKGLIRSEQRHSDDFLYVDPVDVKTSIDMIGTSSPHYAPVFKSMWQSGEQYYWNCLARQAQLKVILENPEAKDFGLSNVDRCRGYSEHLKQILLNQHAKLSAFTKSYCQYHKMILEIKNPALLKSSSFPSQAEFSKWLDTLENVSVKCWQGLSQFQMLLKCCPQANPSGNTSCVTPLPVHMLPQTAFMSINNQTWNVCIEKINDILSKLKTILKKPVTKLKTKSIFSWNDLCFLDAGYLRLKESLVPLQQIKRMFLEPEYNSDSSFSESLSFLQLEIETNTNAFFIWKQRQSDMKTEVLTTMTQQLSGQTSDCEGLSDVNQKDRTLPFDMSLNDLTDSFDNLIKQVLLAIQKLLEAHKKTAKSDDPPKGSGDKEGSSPETCDNDIEILNGHLTQCLQQSLFTDIKNLDCDKVFKIIKELLQVIQSPSEHLAKFSQQQMASELSMKSIWLKCFVGCLPLLELFECLLENYLLYLLVAYRTTAKLYSELLTHFIELATKGFFILPELSDETQEGATQFEDKEDAGMGEGEGVKDVSDQIEDENQLEDVHHKDKQKPDEPENQPDIASEDNAIEMSEDFDGKIHDPDEEVDENDSENENEDEEDIDKQMGDVESKGSDKLDEQLWGSDEEDEETPMEEEKESGTGAGQEEEKQIVAKNENEVKAEEKKNKDEGKEEEEEEEEGKENPEDKKEDKVNEPEAMDESECNDKVDPYHGKPQQEETAENLELPEDLKLDEAENDKEKEEKMDTSLQEDEEKDKDPTEDKETASMDEEPETQEREAEKDKKADEMEEEDGSGNEGKSKEDPTAPPESVEEDEGVEEEEEGVKDNKADMSDAEDEESEKTKNIDDIPAVVELKEENKDESGEDDDSEAVKDASKFYGMTDDQNQKAECEFALDTGGDNEKEKDRKQQTDGANTAPSDAEAYHSKTSTEISHGTNEDDSQKPQTRKPGMTDDNRSLGMQDKPHQRHARTIEEIHHDTGMEEEVEKPKDEKADLYQHVTESTSHYDQQIMDVATEDQQKACAADYDEDDDEDDDDIESIKDSDASYYEEEDFDEDEDDEDDDDVEMIESNIVKNSVQPNVIEEYVLDDDDDEDALVEGDESQVQDNSIEIPGSKIVTEGASRPPESSIHTVIKYLDKEDIVDMEELRAEIEEQLSIWSANQHYGNVVDFERQASDLWQMYEQMTNALAQELCEQLRLVLEPSQATKLKGDYRTGKRINMKKVIPYIASQFRKDKIWLRRTKPSKRQYQIMLAIDDSSSMIDNHSKQLAFESLAVIANGLSLLETGELAICSFGESMQVIHSFGEQFSCHSGARLLQHFTFTQKKTNIALLLQQASALMMESRQHYRSAQSGPDFSQLLLIVSDGRGLFSEGMDYVKSAVRQAQTANLFVVFVILDNPINRDSILDIRIPVFKASGQLPEIKSYMDHFPFPFYIILRDIDSLPQTLSEALRQWFELVTAETQ